ncbi:hypothetical protein DWQ65_12785 [Treponema phagedenis]|uniref:Diguanylate cyclase (GGDEF) domain protein n=1 Tax=Treponema phagedenis TaxID=162 RepID=A0A0B7GT23_TREPH|nr:hypothetical protein [Treponema phagedenis]EFW36561.1 diguanylate cyclase (GGDEF) domain protein [Treponema phagedenis F0421]NVP23337.1 hypothetical protein [Treponema phagedenis]QEJ95552.1 hypothetical protein FUT79_10285 [Treponema phagedenis]QEJ98444.1 hypothetical protein FUT82_10850 [Treponema phagedenis]QEK01405.1 hypothetical protein FUT84_09755 [Treponema phagedenis]
MSKISIRIYAIFVTVVIVFTILWFALSVSSAVQKNTEGARVFFSQTAQRFFSLISPEKPVTQANIEEIKKICEDSGVILALHIASPQSKLFNWAKDGEGFKYNKDNELELSDNPLFVKVFSGQLGENQSSILTFTAAINILPTEFIFARFRAVFFIVLFLALLSAILLSLQYIYLPASTKRVQNKEKEKFSFESAEPAATSTTSQMYSQDSNESTDSYDSSKKEAFSFAKKDSDLTLDSLDNLNLYKDYPENNFFDDQEFSKTNTETAPDQTDSTTVEASAFDEPIEENDQRMELGLFTPITGIGWESYLSERLEAELGRATASDNDLTLMLIKIPGVVQESELAVNISHRLVETFQFRDMIFEFGNDGFAGILQDTSLDEAMPLAENLRADILQIEGLDTEAQVFIGITTRTARLTSAERLLEEASGALQKAEESSGANPIIAFRVSASRY